MIRHFLLLMLLLLVSSCNSDYTLYLIAGDESYGVQETVTPVILNGKNIGDVDNIIPTDLGTEIPITIRDGLEIPANSVFTIVDGKEFGTEKQISITPGSSIVYLRDGDTVSCNSLHF